MTFSFPLFLAILPEVGRNWPRFDHFEIILLHIHLNCKRRPERAKANQYGMNKCISDLNRYGLKEANDEILDEDVFEDRPSEYG